MTNIYDSLGINGGLNISANSTTDAIYISQLGTGNAVLIEDSSNPDASPFIINSGGSVNIGRIEYLSTSGGTQSKLQVNNSTSQIPSSGLPFTTNFIVQGFNNNNIGFFTTDINTSQLYFGTPSSVYGAKLSWRYTGGTFDLSTQTTGGTITFGTDQGLERMRIQSDGNVGIGTTAATSTLSVNGSLSATTLYGDGSNLTGVGASSFSGGTINGETTFTNGVSANTISASTIDMCSTNGTLYTSSISGCSPINILSEVNINNGLTATTISASTIYGDGSNLTGISGGGSFTGGTVSGSTIFTNTVSANTMSATTLYVGGNSISRPYKVYTALISQNGTDAPTANVVLENTLDYVPFLNRGVTGNYVIGVTASTLTQIYTIIGNNRNIANLDIISQVSGGPPPYQVYVYTFSGGTLTDGILSNTPIEIRVYN